MFYVYEWFIENTNEIIYVGKGTKNRYKVRKHNWLFQDYLEKYECSSRIVKYFEDEQEAFDYEENHIVELQKIGQCKCNLRKGGYGGTTTWWTEELKKYYSQHNVMKSKEQRERMKNNNPMSNLEIVKKTISKKRSPVIIDGKEYCSIKEAAQEFSVTTSTIRNWCLKGLSSSGLECKYKYIKDSQKHTCKKASTIPIIINGIKFSSVRQASIYYNIKTYYIYQLLNKQMTSEKYKCEYDNQQPSQGNTDNSTLKGSETNG